MLLLSSFYLQKKVTYACEFSVHWHSTFQYITGYIINTVHATLGTCQSFFKFLFDTLSCFPVVAPNLSHIPGP